MFESYDTQKRRKAIALVLEDKLTPSQVARALNYTGRAVRLWVREYLALYPNGPVPDSSCTPPSFDPLSTSPDRRMAQPSDTFSFLPVVLDAPTPQSTTEPRSISFEIVTPGGYTIRFFDIHSTSEAAELIRTLGGKPC
jgi:hypothetical protein